MLTIYLIAFAILNAFMAFGNGYVEGILDNTCFRIERIAGFRKHNVYTLTRGCFWTAVFMCLIQFWKDDPKALLIKSSLFMGFLLLQFKFWHGGAYHIFRNRMNPEVSPGNFYENGDGKSGSFMDFIFGYTFQARLNCYVASFILLQLLYGFHRHIIKF